MSGIGRSRPWRAEGGRETEEEEGGWAQWWWLEAGTAADGEQEHTRVPGRGKGPALTGDELIRITEDVGGKRAAQQRLPCPRFVPGPVPVPPLPFIVIPPRHSDHVGVRGQDTLPGSGPNCDENGRIICEVGEPEEHMVRGGTGHLSNVPPIREDLQG